MLSYEDAHKFLEYQTARKYRNLVKAIYHSFNNRYFKASLLLDSSKIDKNLKYIFRKIDNTVEDERIAGKFKLSTIIL